MKKRRTRLLALALSACLTMTSFSPVSAASEMPSVVTEAESSGDNMLENIVSDEDISETEISEPETPAETEIPEAPTETEVPQEPTPTETEVPQEPAPTEAPEETPVETETPDAAVEEENVQSSVVADTTIKSEDAVWKKDDATDRFQLYTKDSMGDQTLVTSIAGIVEVISPSSSSVVNGMLQIDRTTPTRRYYAFDSNGYMLTGLQTTTKGNQYYFTTEGKLDTDVAEGTEMTPENSTLGSMVVNGWAHPTATKWIYMGANGLQDTTKVGLQKIGENSYFLNEDGTMLQDDLKKIDGKWYAFNKYGIMVTNDFYKYSKNNATYYFQEDGTKLEKSGWQKLNGSFYYFRASGYSWAIKSGFRKIKDTDGKTYTFYFNNAGLMFKSKFYKKNDNEWYYLDANGHMVTGEKKLVINGKNYYYYFRPKAGSKKEPVGSAVVGWYKIGDYWHYYSKKYKRAATGPDVKKIGKYRYYFTASGKAQRGGFRDFGGKRYYVNPQSGTVRPYIKQNCWIKKGSKWYRATADGSLAKGWTKIGKYWYYFGSDYIMDKACQKTKGSQKGYLDDNGRFITNSWVKLKGNYKYIDAKSGFVTGWKTIDGYKYYFTSNGYLSQDVRRLFAGRSASQYRLEVNRKTCTVNVFTKDTSTGKYNIPVVSFLCSVGQPITRTPLSSTGFTSSRGGRWQILMGPSYGQYATNVYAGIIYIHSVASGQANPRNLSAVEFNRLGTPASHGCIRVCVSDAKWIWENCAGCKVIVYDNANDPGPFDKPTLPKMSPGQNYDPTDPSIPGTKPSPHTNPA